MVKPRKSTAIGLNATPGYYRRVQVELAGSVEEDDPDHTQYPFCLPVVQSMLRQYPDGLPLHPHITIFCGENGSGKSTLLEAIAGAAGINPEGGSKNLMYPTRVTSSTLNSYLKLHRGARKERDGYFLRAECMYNVATALEILDKEGAGERLLDGYGGESLHDQSHGESFFALLQNRLYGDGFYLFDEPEAALSPSRQFYLLRQMHLLAYTKNCQIIIATHSPILMASPGAQLYQINRDSILPCKYTETDAFRVMRAYLADPATAVSRAMHDAEAELQPRRTRKSRPTKEPS